MGHGHAEPGADIEHDVAKHRLGIEQRAIHIEDDGRERPQGFDR
jgi:hypothetical protein